MYDRHSAATFILTTHSSSWSMELGGSQNQSCDSCRKGSIMYPCLGPDLGQYAKLFWEFGLNCNYHDWWLPAAENLLQCYGRWTFGQSQDKGQPVSAELPWFECDMKDSRTGARASCKGKQKCVQRHCLFKIPSIWWNQTQPGVLLKNVKHTYFCVTSIKY